MARNLDMPPPPPDKLEAVRDALRRDRDLRAEIADMTESLKQKAADLLALEHAELPDMFAQLGLTTLGLEAQGNRPAVNFRLAPYYKANIATDWPAERREAAFTWIAARDPDTDGPGPKGGDNPDIIKTVITLTFGRDERERAQKWEQYIRECGVTPAVKLDVPWNTLTAFVRELVEERKIMPPLDLLGAQVGRIVTIKPEKK